ncbi:MAG: putative dsRNA-binding protein, partial [Chlamydiales bacterium]|nr:putative dsRNA-binding protein [Chlamydiales bacterium]
WNRSDPKWRQGNFDFRDFVWGKLDYNSRVIETWKNVIIPMPEQNYKALLQEYTQKAWQKIPVYKVQQESGPDHERIFLVGVFIDHECISTGSGPNKKEAERHAAKGALEKLQGTL